MNIMTLQVGIDWLRIGLKRVKIVSVVNARSIGFPYNLETLEIGRNFNITINGGLVGFSR
mgnify:CR=1 FL=1